MDIVPGNHPVANGAIFEINPPAVKKEERLQLQEFGLLAATGYFLLQVSRLARLG
jgi:hypothetical protein